MTNRKEAVADLRQKLPYGSFRKIQRRLVEKGISFSVQYISRVLHPDRSDYNRTIIEEAILVAKEYAIQMNEMHKKMAQLKKACV